MVTTMCRVCIIAAQTAILLCYCTTRARCDSLPVVTMSTDSQVILDSQNDGNYYRDLFIDTATDTLYVGARNNIYHINLTEDNPNATAIKLADVMDADPVVNFNGTKATDLSTWTNLEPQDYPPFVDFLKTIGVSIEGGSSTNIYYTYLSGLNLKTKLNYLQNSKSFQYSDKNYGNNLLDVAEQYSSIAHSGISSGKSYRSICEAQRRILEIFYGFSLPSATGQETSFLCERHIRGLTWLDGPRTKLFSLATGLFGTMQLSVSGTNNYFAWLELEASYTAFLNCLENWRGYYWLACTDRLRSPPVKQPLRPAPASNKTFTTASTPFERDVMNNGGWNNGFVPPSPENFLGRKRFCDPFPAPRRLIIQAAGTGQSLNTTVIASSPLTSTPRDTCSNFLMASSFLTGHHPDQATFTMTSDSGNGPGGRSRAVYVLTEIGQEKQLDLNLDYLNLPETLPLTSSASLALVRLLVNDTLGDVDSGSIVMTNPFKYTWVTSPLTRWGKMVKSGSQEQVPRRPRAVRGLFERDKFIYFFFREVEWERLPLPEYDIDRHHFQLNSYSRALYYPWERAYVGTAFDAAASGRPFIRQEEQPGQTREELYAPPLLGWRHAWTQAGASMTGRVARVCKNDAGMPIGVQDGSVFNLDPGLSLRSFQTFVKSKLTCLVPVPATPNVWRFRRDVARSSDRGLCDAVLLTPDELYGKDLHYRAVSRNETVTLVFGSDTTGQAKNYVKYYYLSHCRGYKWAYIPKPVMLSSSYVEYSELRDVQQVGNTFYGVFTTPLSEEQQHSLDGGSSSSSQEAVFGSALCSFTAEDIESAFSGPFKRRINNAWRPYVPGIEGPTITPNPYSCDGDPELAQAQNISSMNIDFLDETLPIVDEMRQFDMRGNASSRLRFFEEDLLGSRTMWSPVHTIPVLSRANVIFEKLAFDEVTSYTVLFAATSSGEIYKILSWQRAPQRCWSTSPTEMEEWIKSPYMKDVLDNKLYPLYNRTARGIASDLTMEKNLTFPGDFLFTSDWNCTPTADSRLLSILRPFGTDKRKVWSMVLHKGFLVVATDFGVVRLSVRGQCRQYPHCIACATDPHCSWNGTACESTTSTSNSWTHDASSSKCTGCPQITKEAAIGGDLILQGLPSGANSASELEPLKWYFNGSLLALQLKVYMTTESGDLIVFNFAENQSGPYELRDTSSGTCIVRYQVSVKDCNGDLVCRYEREHAEWKKSFQSFKDLYAKWYTDCGKSDYCKQGTS